MLNSVQTAFNSNRWNIDIIVFCVTFKISLKAKLDLF